MQRFAMACIAGWVTLSAAADVETSATDTPDPEQSRGEDRTAEQPEKSTHHRLVISAVRNPFASQVPESIAAINLSASDVANQSVSVLSLVDQAPGVAANGQGGLFQTWSIRGVAKHRIKTLVNDIPLTTERRAGISASFIDPALVDSVDVVSGPVSTFYGSGALGGVVNVFLPENTGASLTLGSQTQGGGQWLSASVGDTNTHVAASYRDVGQSEAANGEILNDAYRLTNLYAKHHWQLDSVEYQVFWLGAEAQDIGKSNLQYPDDRITVYPKEQHQLVKLNAKSDAGWSVSLFYHPNELITETERVGRRVNTTYNQSDDFGGSWQTQFWHQDTAAAQWGIDWFSRRGVSARELELDLQTNARSETIIMADASLDDWALFISGYWEIGQSRLHLGARYNRQEQQASGSSPISDSAYSGFVGLDLPLAEHWQLTLNLASGFRFPTLSERFFTGTTPRGEVTAVAELDTERSLNLDTGLRYQRGGHDWSLRYFHMQVENYIERITLADGSRTYINLDQGNIRGAEMLYQLSWQQQDLNFSYTQYRGTNEQGLTLADIPARKLALNYHWQKGNWSWFAGWTRQFSKHRVGSGELQRPAHNLLSTKVNYQLSDHWSLTVFVNNALNELYIPTSDDLDTIAAGRNVGINILWQDR